MKYKIIDSLYEIFKNRIIKYLHKNNLRTEDISKKEVIRINNHLCFRVTFKNGKYHDFRFFPYKLTKSGALFLSSTITISTFGTIALAHFGNYKFKTNGDDSVTVEATTLAETEEAKLDQDIVQTTESTSLTYEYTDDLINPQETYESTNIIYEFTPDDSERTEVSVSDGSEIETEPAVNTNNRFYREISLPGSYDPCATSYDHILDCYYDSIKKYGDMYGVDPSLIAALIMEEVGDQDYEFYQSSYSCLGLGQVNCNYFEGEVFHTYNYELGEYEDYTFRYNNIAYDRDEQIKVIAIFLQRYIIEFEGNIYFALVAYNQGVTTAERLASYVTNSLDYDSKSDTYHASDIGSLPDYNHYTHGDPQYFNKVMTFLNFILENKVFNDSGEAYIYLPDSSTVMVFGVNLTEVNALKGNR